MKKTCLLLLPGLLTLTGRAQKDSSHLDIGWLVLDRGLTQTISIKGSDLERMPFVNLGDAISAWLYGAYTKPATLAYVVDGNPVTDVNSYPIFDIEEVTLVESAVGGAAYGGTQQELVVITTRRGGEGPAGEKGKSGIRAAAQGGAVNSNGDGIKTDINFYQQYYVGGYRNYDKLSVGGSADWVRDVVPMPSGPEYQVNTPENLQRLRFNGYLTWKPTTSDLIELRVGYAPQWVEEGLDSNLTSGESQITAEMHSHLVVPEARWYRRLWRGLNNELQVADAGASSYSAWNLINSGDLEDTAEARVNHLYVHERLSYEVSAGGWHFVPSLNFSYDHITEKTVSTMDSVAFVGGVGGGGQFVVFDLPLGPWQKQTGDLLFLTPAVDVRLARLLDLQLGAQIDMSSRQENLSQQAYPFATLGMDVLQFGGGRRVPGGGVRGSGVPGRDVAGRSVPSLKLYGSYAERPLVFVDDYSLYDFEGGGAPYSLASVYPPATTSFVFSSYSPTGGTISETILSANEPRPVFWTWEAGASFTTAGSRMQFGYTFEKRNLVTSGGISYLPAMGLGTTVLPVWKSTMHHADLRFRVTDSTGLVWLTGLHLTLMRSESYFSFPDVNFSSIYGSYQFPQAGDFYPAHFSYTGGWVNRWNVGNFSAGLDLMYRFGEATEQWTAYGSYFNGPRLNSVLLSNIYAGNRWKLQGARILELFIESRGLARSKSSDLPDDRRYYTIGGKLSM
ncbi:MAG TPA: hypothetical protein VL978_01930 [Puia sp.]|nr:hypothetical protein [Puia sp.]